MRTKLGVSRIMVVLMLVALLLSACGPAPTATPVPPTATPIPPTATPKPALNLAAAIGTYLSALPDGWGTIKPAALQEQMAAAKPFILDLRQPAEITETIQSAVNISIRDLAKNLDKLPAKDQPIVTICAVGHRGGMAMMVLQMLGYTNVKSLAGGLNAWKAANLPVVSATAALPAACKAPDVDKDLLAAFDKYLSALPDGWGTVKPAALQEQMAAAKPFILDLRQPAEITETIQSAVNISIRDLTKSLDKLPAKDQPIITICAIGHRGAMAMMALQMLGYTNVKSLAGGLNAWKAANLPVVSVAK